MSDYHLPNKFDRIIHQPSRLSIMAVLAGCDGADFNFLLQTTRLTNGTLSKHLKKLENSGYITITKSFKGNYPNTFVSITKDGRMAFNEYRRQYGSFIQFLNAQQGRGSNS